MNTSLILRPKDAPKIHVLEVDGPRDRQTERRSQGRYRIATDNHPIIDRIGHYDMPPDSRLKDWDQPSWEIYQLHDGSVEIHACRPTHQETMRGDLHGRWGSVIHLRKSPNRQNIRVALQLARILCRCIPTIGFTINPTVMFDVEWIETEIPVKSTTGVRFSKFTKAS